MKVISVSVEKIAIGDRSRIDMGNLDALCESITERGLLHPIVVDSDYKLVAGGRRLAAVKQLGGLDIPCHVVTNLTTAEALLQAERDENTARKDLTPSETKALTDRLLEIERVDAKRRQREHGGTAPGVPAVTSDHVNGSVPRADHEAKSRAAKAAGSSRATYGRISAVVDAAEDETLPAEIRKVAQEAKQAMDAGTITPYKAFQQVKAAKNKQNRPSAPPRRGGNHRRHKEQIEALINALDGAAAAFADVETLDSTITAGEATRLTGDLSKQIGSLNQINKLLKERTA